MKYSEKQKKEIVDKICEQISTREDGSLRKILRETNLVGRGTFYQWLDEKKSFQDQYARACEDREDLLFENIRDTAAEDCTRTMYNSEGVPYEVTDSAKVQQQRLKIDADKWILSKMNPKKYGDKVQQEHSGEVNINQITGMEIK